MSVSLDDDRERAARVVDFYEPLFLTAHPVTDLLTPVAYELLTSLI